VLVAAELAVRLRRGSGAHRGEILRHVRLLLRTLLQQCVAQVGRLTVLAAREHVETEQRCLRAVGYESLQVRFSAS
jgi:hypothetical protein